MREESVTIDCVPPHKFESCYQQFACFRITNSIVNMTRSKCVS